MYSTNQSYPAISMLPHFTVITNNIISTNGNIVQKNVRNRVPNKVNSALSTVTRSRAHRIKFDKKKSAIYYGYCFSELPGCSWPKNKISKPSQQFCAWRDNPFLSLFVRFAYDTYLCDGNQSQFFETFTLFFVVFFNFLGKLHKIRKTTFLKYNLWSISSLSRYCTKLWWYHLFLPEKVLCVNTKLKKNICNCNSFLSE